MPSSLLLEQDAITIRDEYDLLTEEEKPAAAAWLRDYTAQQEKSGQPLFPLEQAAQRERSQQIEKLYKNLEAVPSPIPVGEPAEANRARALYANVQLLQALYPDYKPEQHDLYKADYALRQFGSAEMDENRFYTQVQGQFEKQERRNQAVLSASSAAFRSAAQNQDALKGLNEWQAQSPDFMEASPEFVSSYARISQRLQPYRQVLNEVAELARGMDENPEGFSWSKMADKLLTVPAEDRPLVMEALAQSKSKSEEGRMWVQRLAMSMDRGLERFVDTGLTGLRNTLEDFSLSFVGRAMRASSGFDVSTDFDPENVQLRENYAQYQDLRDDLRDIASQKLSPLKDVRLLGANVSGMVENAPMVIGSFVPYVGPAMLVGSMQRETANNLRSEYPMLDRASRESVATWSAPFQAAIEVFSNRFMFGKLPNLKRVLTSPALTPSGVAAQLAGRWVIGSGVETTEEFLQGATPLAVMEIQRALQKDVPEVKWKKYLSGFVKNMPELASIVVPMALIGAGTAQFSDFSQARNLARSEDVLLAAQYSAESAREISQAAQAGDWKLAEQLMRADWKIVNQAGDSLSTVAARAAATAQEQLLTKMQSTRGELDRRLQAAEISIGRMEGGWRVTSPTGSVQFQTHEEAMTAITIYLGQQDNRLKFSQGRTANAREQTQNNLAQQAIQNILNHEDPAGKETVAGLHSDRPGGNAQKSATSVTSALLGGNEGTVSGWAGTDGRRRRGDSERAYLNRRATAPVDKGKKFGEGGEHHIYGRTDDNFVTKATHSGKYGQVFDQMGPEEGYRFSLRPALPSEYLTRVGLSNVIFGDNVRVIGYEQTPAGPSIITTQPLLKGPHPKQSHIDEFLRESGFEPMSEKLYDTATLSKTKRPWYRQRDGVVIVDAKRQNFILHNGKVTPVDLIIQVLPDAVLNATQAQRQYSQANGAEKTHPTLGTTLGSSEQLGQTLAQTARFLNQKQPGLVNEHTHLFTTVEALLASDYARQHPFTAEQIASLRTAEGFHDGKTGHSIVIAENTRLLPGENAQQALTRVVLHERVGHAGLQILLGAAESPRARRWAALSAQIPQAELDAIAGEAAYQKLAGDRSALAYEWFARRTEKDASLLEKDSLPRQMWEAFREMVMDVMARVGLNPTLGRSFETQVNDLKIRARNAALRPIPQAVGSTGPAPEARLQFSHRSGAGQAAYGTGGDGLVSPFDASATTPTNQRTHPQEEMARMQQALHEVLNSPVDTNIQQELEKLRAADTTASTRKHIETTTFTSRKLIQGGGINFAFELRNGVPVIYKPALFQSREKIRAGIEPSTQWRREIAASLVAEHLSISLIPPTGRIESINGEGSAQLMKEGFITGKKMSAILKDPFFDARKLVTDEIAEDWQLLEDLLLETDRHQSNYMIRVNDQNKVIELALIDNGLCLSANPGVLKKRHNGPREMHSIGLKNLQRLRHMISHQEDIERDLEPYLENAAVAGLFARAKALLIRGTYGNFVLEEINYHLPPNLKVSRQVDDYEINE